VHIEGAEEMNTAEIFGYILTFMYGLAMLLIGYKMGLKEGSKNVQKT